MFWRFSRSLFAPWFIIYWYHTGENATQVILSPVKGAGFSHSLIPCRSRAKQFTWRFGDTSPKMPLHTRQEIPSHEPITTFFTYVGPDFVIEWQRRCWSVYTVSFPTSPILRWYTKSDTVSERTESRREGVHMEGSEKIPDVSSTASETRKVSLNWKLYSHVRKSSYYLISSLKMCKISQEVTLLLRKID